MAEVFRRVYYHVVWSTKHRDPQVVDWLRPHLLEAVASKCRRLGCTLHAANAVHDHIHLALEIPPSLAVSAAVGQIKGASSHEVNQFEPGALHWQDGYGVVTFRERDLPRVKDYIATQEDRHRVGRLSSLLEDDGGSP